MMFKKKFKEEYEFLPDVLEIIEKPVAPLGRFIIWLIFLIIISAIVWSYVGKVDMVAVSTGTVIPEGDIKMVQPLEEGIVLGIFVTDGQHVEQGDPLIEMDTAIEEVDQNTYIKRSEELNFEKRIINELLEEQEISAAAANAEQQLILDYYQSRNNNYINNLELLDAQISQSQANTETEKLRVAQIEENITSVRQMIEDLTLEMERKSVQEQRLDAIEKQIQSLEPMVEGNKQMLDEGVLPRRQYEESLSELEQLRSERDVQAKVIETEKVEQRTNLYSLQSEEAALNSQLQVQKSAVLETELEIRRAQKNKDDFILADQKELRNTLLDLDRQYSEYQGQLNKVETNITYSKLTAPVAGRINGLTVNTLGAVVKPAEALLSIVPDDTELICETMLLNKDSGFVKEGQETVIKVDTYPFQKFGTIKGTVISVSPNAYLDERLGYVYKIRIRMEAPYLLSDGLRYEISPGMQVRAEIKTGERRVIDFFLEPLVKYLDESIKVR